MSNRTKRFIASTGPNNSIKLFEASTGNLYRTVTLGHRETLLTQPICTESEVFVTVQTPDGQKSMKYFSLPNLGLVRTVNL
jgi:hypothetical protein